MAPIALQDKKVAPAKPDRVTTPNSIGLRLGRLESIRDAIETELESIFSGRKAVKQGLDDAVAKSNTLLKEFAATSK
jgi:sn-glycerol 3-phosphate transport system substrate-binding protein